MQLGMIGLGRMGQNMVYRLTKAGHECVVSDTKPEVVQETVSKGEGKVAGAKDLKDLIAVPDEARVRIEPQETSAEPWKHLVRRQHPWRRSRTGRHPAQSHQRRLTSAAARA